MTRFDKFKSELTLEKLAELYTRKCKCEVCARQYNDTCDYNCVFDIGEDYCTEGVKQYFREEIKNEDSKENM